MTTLKFQIPALLLLLQLALPAFGGPIEDQRRSSVDPMDMIIDGAPVGPDGNPANLPPSLEQVLEDRLREMGRAPTWVKTLRTRTVADYFAEGMDEKHPDWSKALARIQNDAVRLHEYFEESDKSGLYNGFVEKQLSPFIQKIDAKTLRSPVRKQRLTRPIAEWTIEVLVVTEQVAFLSRRPEFVSKALGLLTGKHLKGASAVAGAVVLGGVGLWVSHHFGFSGLGTAFTFVTSALGGAIQAGPLAAIVNALTSWGVTPTTEFIKVKSSRYTAPLEQKINGFYDRFKSQEDPGNTTQNVTPRYPTVEEDGMDFAGMSIEEQRENWEKDLRMYVTTSKTYRQLLRDTHHDGRVLMMVGWTDEQHATNLVETMDHKLVSLNLFSENILQPYKTAILIDPHLNADGRQLALAQLQANFDLLQALYEKKWMDLDMTPAEEILIDQQIEMLKLELMKNGMTARDFAKLVVMERKKMRAHGTIVTALTLNEIRTFNVAEANRNLMPEARQAQRAARKGFNLQTYVDEYREHIQIMMQRMGYANSRKPLPAKVEGGICKAALL